MNSSLDYVGNVVYAITSDNNNLAYVAVTCAYVIHDIPATYRVRCCQRDYTKLDSTYYL